MSALSVTPACLYIWVQCFWTSLLPRKALTSWARYLRKRFSRTPVILRSSGSPSTCTPRHGSSSATPLRREADTSRSNRVIRANKPRFASPSHPSIIPARLWLPAKIATSAPSRARLGGSDRRVNFQALPQEALSLRRPFNARRTLPIGVQWAPFRCMATRSSRVRFTPFTRYRSHVRVTPMILYVLARRKSFTPVSGATPQRPLREATRLLSRMWPTWPRSSILFAD
jgi:hypothetical protein